MTEGSNWEYTIRWEILLALVAVQFEFYPFTKLRAIEPDSQDLAAA